MRAAGVLTVVALLGALTAFALPRTGNAANPKLFGTVDDSFTIRLTDAEGYPVTTIPAGTYDIEVTDTTTFHNFDLKQPDGTTVRATTVSGNETVTWTDVALTAGTWTYLCDAHPLSMKDTFTVAGNTTTTTGSTSTVASTTTAPTTTTAPPEPTTTAATPPPPPSPPPTLAPTCRVPAVVGKPLPVARRAIGRAHCRVGAVLRRFARRRRGIVVGQAPRAGTRLRNGARVSLAVSRGPKPRR